MYLGWLANLTVSLTLLALGVLGSFTPSQIEGSAFARSIQPLALGINADNSTQPSPAVSAARTSTILAEQYGLITGVVIEHTSFLSPTPVH